MEHMENMMHFVLAGPSPDTLIPWRQAFTGIKNTEFRVGTLPEIGFGCDAQIVPAFLAHDRYGGNPYQHRGQVLENNRGDGSPDLIVSTPLHGPILSWNEGNEKAIARISEIFRASLEAIERYNSTHASVENIHRILINVNAMGTGALGAACNAAGLKDALTRP
ncbi:hypothetical protein FOH10_06585 [Nocardia otitidiscaviarum]|uniref:Uncharacterized protein n=1 Tax=Nocardia otitidiscaviarum TaxID=1823 RepID=A0A516NHR8_9NOCA|nr:hypothetical protein [Nocardia otitidiscaviarum]MCP9620040.1 hypothetical protein [Nocardia otitidiscaviarum]QDP78457.1 hypothetical protein FOH10_06585 [Nocardia otitidiscaviarum]